MIREDKDRQVESTNTKAVFVFVSEELLPVMIMPLFKTEVAVLSITAPERLFLSLHTSIGPRACVYVRVQENAHMYLN